MLVYWIWLSVRQGISDKTKYELLEKFGSAEGVYFASSGELEGLSEKERASLADKDLNRANRILEQCSREDIHLLTVQDAAYPRRLRAIPDPPVVLYYKGKLPDFDSNAVIGIVGTRQPSAYGMSTAYNLSYQISRCGGLVVTGMAKGIDTMAATGALAAETVAVGVLGCGVDIVYPAANRELFRRVLEKGCLISEMPPGAQGSKWSFPRRNRIISGLSCGVVVVEAPQRSGALITAAHAMDQGRDVFVVPGNMDVESFVGSNQLLREGAGAIYKGWDVLEEYEHLFPDKLHREQHPGTTQPPVLEQEKPSKSVLMVADFRTEPENTKEIHKLVIDNKPSGSYSDLNDILAGLPPEERAIVQALRCGERLADDVIAETGMSTGKFLASMTMLEMKGILVRSPGKRIRLKT